MDSDSIWKVGFSRKASGQMEEFKKKLPKIRKLVLTLVKDIEKNGPYRTNWRKYGPLEHGKRIPENSHHCHIKNGRPTYVACWSIENKKVKIISMVQGRATLFARFFSEEDEKLLRSLEGF